MSSRVLKKLQGGDLELQQNEEDEQPSEDDEVESQRTKKNNFFDLVSFWIINHLILKIFLGECNNILVNIKFL